jgi:hypothetical protein
MIGAGTFLAGAQSRLLPLSVPFRFFAAAAVYHVAFWAVLVLAAGDLVSYRGGPGPLLAATHLLTLGVLAMTAIGASLQLLPVATRRPVGAMWPCGLVFWLLAPGVGGLAYGMATLEPLALGGGGLLVGTALGVYAALIARNLRGAEGFRVVVLHGWLAIGALIVLVLLGLALAADFHRGFLANHSALAGIHLVIASYGFMGSLAVGFSFVLVPMFALAHTMAESRGIASFALSSAALALAVIGIAAGLEWLIVGAAAIGLAGAGCYLAAMAAVLKSGMRKRLGLSFALVRAAWLSLPLSLALGLGLSLDLLPAGGAALFGLALLVGWLLTFLLGILQRIAPFLASMHSTAGGGRAARPSDLTAELPLKIHAACHALSILLLAGGILAQSAVTVRLGALLGLTGALAFAAFLAGVPIRLAAHTRRVRSAAQKTA